MAQLLRPSPVPPAVNSGHGSSVPDIDSHLLDRDDKRICSAWVPLDPLIIGSLTRSCGNAPRTTQSLLTKKRPRATVATCRHHGVHLRCATRILAQEPRLLRSFRCLQCLPRKEGTPRLVESWAGREHRQGYVTREPRVGRAPVEASGCRLLLQRSGTHRALLTPFAEVQRDVLTTNLMFSGLRADLTKAFSFNPLYVPGTPTAP